MFLLGITHFCVSLTLNDEIHWSPTTFGNSHVFSFVYDIKI